MLVAEFSSMISVWEISIYAVLCTDRKWGNDFPVSQYLLFQYETGRKSCETKSCPSANFLTVWY